MGLYKNANGVLSPIAGVPLATLTGLQEQLNKSGAKNLAPPPAASATINGVTFTVNGDGSITGNGTKTSTSTSTQLAGRNFTAYASGIVKLSGGSSRTFHLYPWDVTNGSRPYKDETKTSYAETNQYDSDGELQFYIEKSNLYTIVTRLLDATSVDNETTYPMVRWAGDFDPTYTPYAMTNKELTYKADYKEIARSVKDGTKTYGQQVMELKPYFDALSFSDKLKVVINVDNADIYRCVRASSYEFSRTRINGSGYVYIDSWIYSNSAIKMIQARIQPDTTIVYNDITNTISNYDFILLV